MYLETFNHIDRETDFCVLYAGEQTCPPGHAYGGIRDHWLLHFVLSGHGTVRVAGQRYQPEAGDAFLFPPGQAHQYAADRQRPWHYLWIGFGGRQAAASLAGTGFAPGRHLVRAAEPAAQAERFHGLIETLASGSRSPHEATRAQGLAILAGFRPDTALPAGPAPAAAAAADGWPAFKLVPVEGPRLIDAPPAQAVALANVRKLLLFFDTNYHRPIGIKQAADWVHLDRTYCARIFRQHTGTSMQDYLTAIRMLRARRLLLDTDLPVKAVASSVGFMDYATFAKRFHAENGTTPQAFRARPLSREPRGKPR